MSISKISSSLSAVSLAFANDAYIESTISRWNGSNSSAQAWGSRRANNSFDLLISRVLVVPPNRLSAPLPDVSAHVPKLRAWVERRAR